MARKLFLYLFLAVLLLEAVPVVLVSPILALEKVKLGTPTKVGVASYLPVLTAEQRGLWKDNGLEVEWVPFIGAAPQMRAVAAGVLNVGLVQSDASMATAEKGVPVTMVAEYISQFHFYIWVKTDSPYRHPRDLKGARIGVTTLGGTFHAYARVIAKTHGIEKDVRFVGAGGSLANLAGFKAGAFDASLLALTTAILMKGQVRPLTSLADYLPKPWVQYTVFSRKDYARNKPDELRKVIRATLQAADFIRKNPRWAIELMKNYSNYSEEDASLVYKEVEFNATGRIDRKGVENARKFYLEYGIITEKVPPVDELFTNEFISG